jgi:hypothetical protein
VDLHLARDVTVVSALRDGWAFVSTLVYSAIRCRTTRSACAVMAARTLGPADPEIASGQDEDFDAGHLRPRRGARCVWAFTAGTLGKLM